MTHFLPLDGVNLCNFCTVKTSAKETLKVKFVGNLKGNPKKIPEKPNKISIKFAKIAPKIQKKLKNLSKTQEKLQNSRLKFCKTECKIWWKI